MPKADTKNHSKAIRDLNDAFRRSFTGGRVMQTSGVMELPSDVRAKVVWSVSTFDAFTADNDPHGEHDFGAFEVAGQKFFFKIDYYDKTLESGSQNPADPTITTRVLTIMLAEEY